MCPGNNESAGKHRSGKARKGSKWLREALVESAHAAAATKSSYLSAHNKCIARRRCKRKAAVAVGHTILVAAYYMLTRDVPFKDLGGDYFIQRQDQPRTHPPLSADSLSALVTA